MRSRRGCIADIETARQERNRSEDPRGRTGLDEHIRGLERLASEQRERHTEAKTLRAKVSDQLADLEIKWYEARVRERGDRGLAM